MVIVPVVAPAGTVVEMEVAVLVSTVANVPLKLTMLLAGVILKLVPAIVTGVPTIPLNALRLVIVGCALVTDERSVTNARSGKIARPTLFTEFPNHHLSRQSK